MKPLTVAAIVIMTVVLTAPAYSQGAGRGLQRKEEPKVDPEKKKAEDKAYNDALSRIPPKEFDPWQGVREKPPAEKPPASQKKTGR